MDAGPIGVIVIIQKNNPARRKYLLCELEVRTENLGLRAIAAAREFRPDLILLDVMMPGVLGSEIAAQLQVDPELRAIKFVFLTAVVTKEEALRSNSQIGGHTFVAKPISADELCRVVEDQLR
jgi:two-component system OmpR family response regulator